MYMDLLDGSGPLCQVRVTNATVTRSGTVRRISFFASCLQPTCIHSQKVCRRWKKTKNSQLIPKFWFRTILKPQKRNFKTHLFTIFEAVQSEHQVVSSSSPLSHAPRPRDDLEPRTDRFVFATELQIFAVCIVEIWIIIYISCGLVECFNPIIITRVQKCAFACHDRAIKWSSYSTGEWFHHLDLLNMCLVNR